MCASEIVMVIAHLGSGGAGWVCVCVNVCVSVCVQGARCSSVVRAFAHGAMGWRNM